MEVKIVCECGTKYKFEVEPVDGHMPQPVKCPACGANGTAQANAAIREALGITAAPVESVPGAAAPAAPQVRLSVQRPTAPASHAAATPVASNGGYPGAVSVGGMDSVWKDRGKKALQLAWKGVLILLCVVAMLAGFGGKKGKRVRFLAKITSAVFSSDAEEEDDSEQPNLWGEDIVLLLIKHTNETEVAELCSSFWQDTYKKKVTFVQTNEVEELSFDGNEIAILPARNNCVQIVGGLKWPKEDFEKLTQLLSQKLNTVAVETRDVDFSGAYVFGVFENGEKKFRAEMQLKGKTLEDMEESVTVEGEQWARAHGYKPGKEGFNEFHLGDGDRITRRLGFTNDNMGWGQALILQEVTNRPPARPSVPARTGKAK